MPRRRDLEDVPPAPEPSHPLVVAGWGDPRVTRAELAERLRIERAKAPDGEPAALSVQEAARDRAARVRDHAERIARGLRLARLACDGIACVAWGTNGRKLAEFAHASHAAAWLRDDRRAKGVSRSDLVRAIERGGLYLNVIWRRPGEPFALPAGVGVRRPVCQYAPDGRLVGLYPDIQAAASAVGRARNAITMALRRGRQSAGYWWAYEGAPPPPGVTPRRPALAA